MTPHEQFVDVLSLYALGALEGEERAAVAAHLESCRECREELSRLESDLALLALSAEAAPPARARDKLLAKVRREPRPVFAQQKPRWSWLLIPAFAALALAAIAIHLWNQNRELRQEVAAQRALVEQQRLEAAHAQAVLAVLTSAEAQRVTLVAANAQPQQQGKAVYIPRNGQLVFMASNMPSAPAGKAYELWLLPKSGASPMPAGMFKPDAGGSAMVMMPPLPAGMEAKAFAVTLEPESGSPTPTMPIVISGS
jgi:anti-sigma-K factor RskA